MDYLRSLRVLNIKSVVRRAFRLTSLSEKTRKPNRSPQWTKTLSFSLSRVDPTTSHKVQLNWDKRTEDIYFSLQWWQIVVVYFREYSCHVNSFHSWWTRQITCLPNFGWELVSGCENNFQSNHCGCFGNSFQMLGDPHLVMKCRSSAADTSTCFSSPTLALGKLPVTQREFTCLPSH